MNNFIMLVGLPASGKSCYADFLKDEGYTVHSSDAIRKEIFNDEREQEYNNRVFDILHKRIILDLKDGKDVVYDATNISSKRRRNFLSNISKIDCNKNCIIMATTFEECYNRNAHRERVVPFDVMDRMYHNFETPSYFEGWDNIDIIYCKNDNYIKEYNSINHIKGYNQNNSHHKLTLDSHMKKASELLLGLNHNDRNLYLATLYHDIGKPKTATFYNKKGELCKECRYYNHNNIGAYDSIFYMKNIFNLAVDDIIDVCTLIQWHMQPYFFEKQSTVDKYKNIWGENLFNRIMMLHDADKRAH